MEKEGRKVWEGQRDCKGKVVERATLLISDEGLTLETSALQLVTVANLQFKLSWYNQITF